jgi:hypothetical protein
MALSQADFQAPARVAYCSPKRAPVFQPLRLTRWRERERVRRPFRSLAKRSLRRVIPIVTRRHGDGRRYNAEQGPNDRDTPIVPSIVVRVSNLANGGGVSLLASSDRVITIGGAKGFGRAWGSRRASSQPLLKEVLSVT